MQRQYRHNERGCVRCASGDGPSENGLCPHARHAVRLPARYIPLLPARPPFQYITIYYNLLHAFCVGIAHGYWNLPRGHNLVLNGP